MIVRYEEIEKIVGKKGKVSYKKITLEEEWCDKQDAGKRYQLLKKVMKELKGKK